MSSGTILRSALGSNASLGDLYDARADDFCGITIFKKRIPEDAIKSADSHFSDVHLVNSDDFLEKFSKLDVSAELQVSVLAGLFRLEGSGRYLNDKKTSARTVKSSLVYNIQTKQESVNIYHEDLKDAFAIDAIESGMATHLVVGITWGANSIVSCLYENRENRDITEVSGSLSAQLKKMSLSISGKASVDFNEGETSTGLKFDVRMFGDILSKNEELPTTFEGALNLMKRLPHLVASSNDGKGKPLSYRLVPISLLKRYLNFSIQADITLKQIEESSLIRVVKLFDEISKSQQKIQDFYQDALDYKYCVELEDLKDISTIKYEMSMYETSFRSQLSSTLTSIRSGKSDVSKLEGLMEKFQSSNVCLQNVSLTLAKWGDVMERINFARAMVQVGAKFIGFGQSLDEEIFKDSNSKLVVLFFSKSAKTEQERWGGNLQLFLEETKKDNDGFKYVVVDCDIHSNFKIQSSCVKVFRAGCVIVEDMLTEQKQTGTTSFVQTTSAATRILYKPSKLASFSTVCAGNSCNPSQLHVWFCKQCKKEVEYGFDEHVYCNCGMIPVMSLEFKCNDPEHGPSFQQHDPEFLSQILTTIRSSKKLNILVFGETAEEKRDFIHYLAHSVAHDSWENEEVEQRSKLTPQTLTFQSNDNLQLNIKVNMLTVGEMSIHLIDTPDLTSLEYPVSNIFRSYFDTICHFDEIHGICLIFSKSSSFIGNFFKSQINEIILCVDETVCKNMLFCQSHSQNTLFSSEESMLTLKNLLFESQIENVEVGPNTLYWYIRDNDFMAYKELSEEGKEKKLKCLSANSAEMKRMLDHMKKTQPCLIKRGHTRHFIHQAAKSLHYAILITIRSVFYKILRFISESIQLKETLDKYLANQKPMFQPLMTQQRAPYLQAISMLDNYVEQCEKELTSIEEAFIMLQYFLEPTPDQFCNDEVDTVFEQLIQEERELFPAKVLTLQEQKRQIRMTHRRTYTEQMLRNATLAAQVLDFNWLKNLVRDLQLMKHSGPTFKNAIQALVDSYPTIVT